MFIRETIALAILLGAPVGAQTKKPPKNPPKKPAPQKPAPNKPTLGTVQLPGDNGKVGTTYQLGDKDNELHFTLNSAKIASYFKNPQDNIFARENERLLVLTFTVQNPQKGRDMSLSWNSFEFTAISPNDQNFTSSDYIYQADTLTHYSADLKPAQKAQVIKVVPIYNSGPVKKLMVRRGSGAVLRYDLSESLGKVESIFTTNGIDLANEGPGQIGAKFEVGGREIEVQEVATRSSKVGDYEPSEDAQLITVQVKVTNLFAKPLGVAWNSFEPKLMTEDGEELDWRSDYISMGSGKTIGQDVAPGESVRGLLVFSAPKGVSPNRLKLKDTSTGRIILIPISSVVAK